MADENMMDEVCPTCNGSGTDPKAPAGSMESNPCPTCQGSGTKPSGY
jgi:DnaJ-class molecular chaperone